MRETKLPPNSQNIQKISAIHVYLIFFSFFLHFLCLVIFFPIPPTPQINRWEPRRDTARNPMDFSSPATGNRTRSDVRIRCNYAEIEIIIFIFFFVFNVFCSPRGCYVTLERTHAARLYIAHGKTVIFFFRFYLWCTCPMKWTRVAYNGSEKRVARGPLRRRRSLTAVTAGRRRGESGVCVCVWNAAKVKERAGNKKKRKWLGGDAQLLSNEIIGSPGK